jgi:hypothetical protein
MTSIFSTFLLAVILSTQEDFDLDSVGRVPYLLTSLAEKTYRSCQKHKSKFVTYSVHNKPKENLCTALTRQRKAQNNSNSSHAQDITALQPNECMLYSNISVTGHKHLTFFALQNHCQGHNPELTAVPCNQYLYLKKALLFKSRISHV